MSRDAPSPGIADPLGLRGVVPPTITAYHDDESLDLATTATHARFVVDHGAHGVFPLGTNGEFPLLSPRERDRVVETVVEEVGGEVPVIAGVGAPSTHETVRRAEKAVAAGADGVVVVSPYYYPVDGDAQVRHYRRVASAVDRPVYVYHIPSRTGNELSLATLERLASIEGVAGIKDSSKDVPWLAQAIDGNDDLTFLAGSDSLLFTGFALGCSGVVSAVANAFPELVVNLYDSFDDGDRQRARELQSRVFRVRRALKGGPYLSGVKTALSLRDLAFDPGPVRDPLRTMTDEERSALAGELRALELID